MPDGSTRLNLKKTEVNFDEIFEAALYLIEFMNRQEAGFDGFAGFSQGMQLVIALYKVHRYFSKDTWLRYPLPYFVIDFNAPVHNLGTFEYLRSSFVTGERYVPDVDSLHFISDKDMFASQLINHKNFDNPTVIHHDQGHRPVRTLPMKDLKIVADFLVRQFQTRNKAIEEAEPIISAFY